MVFDSIKRSNNNLSRLRPQILGKLSSSVDHNSIRMSKEKIAREIEKSFNRSKTPVDDLFDE